MSFSWDKFYKLPNISVLRSTNNNQIQSRSMASNHESDGSDLECIYSPGLSSSQGSPLSPSNSGGTMIAQSVAAPIPIAGSTLQSTILLLSLIVRMIDEKKQNVEGVASLKSRLDQLSNRLRKAPATEDPVEQSRRDSLNKVLQRTIDKLLKFEIIAGQEIKPQDTPRVTQAINECYNNINVYLLDCVLVRAQTRIQRQVNRILTATMQSPGVNIKGSVILVDATGHEWSIPLRFCTSYQQLHAMLAVLFESDSSEAQLQQLFLCAKLYDLSIDNDTNVTELTSDNWTTIEADTTIVMRVILPQVGNLLVYSCHFCEADSIVSSTDDVFSQSVTCQGCQRRFQVSEGTNDIPDMPKTGRKNGKQEKIIAKNTAEGIMMSIRNFRVRPLKIVRDVAF